MPAADAHPGILGGLADRVRCDTAVVGSGPGGAVAAFLLAGAGRDVLVLEEGPYQPPGVYEPYSLQEMQGQYRHGGVTVAFGRPKVTYAEGRCVGGGSEINAGLFYRAPDDVVERWSRDFRVRHFQPLDLAPHFAAIEKDLGVGEVPGPPSAQAEKMRTGAERLGVPSVGSPTSFRQSNGFSGHGPPQRASMTRTYLPWALDQGARIAPDTEVRRLRREGGGWRLLGTHGRGRDRRPVEIRARQVFVAGGAVQTPALLRRSGIARNVGDSLAMQTTLKVTARFPEEVNDGATGVPTWSVYEFTPRYQLTCAVSSPAYLALEMIQYPDHFPALEADWRRMAIYSARTSGGRGWVRNVPGFSDPLVYYRLDPRDLHELAEAAQQLCAVLFAGGAEALFPSTLGGGPIENPGDVPRALGELPRSRTNLMTIHLSSTCPMGEDTGRCATDSLGRVHGVDDLHVADASLLPTAPTVNPQGSVMAVVRRNTLGLLEGR